MKICLVCREFPPESGISGTGTYMYSIAKCLERLGHKIIVISYSRNGESKKTDGNITVYRIPPTPIKGIGRLQKWIPVWFLRYSFAVRKKLIQLNRQFRFDIIQIPEWGGEGFFYALKPFCPFVVKVHGPLFLNHAYDRNPKSKTLKFFENWIEKSVVKKANAVIFSSQTMQNVTKTNWKIDFSYTTIIENPIDLNKFKPNNRPRPLPDRKPIILYVGRLEYRKGIQVLIGAVPVVLKDFPRAKFIIVGSDTKTTDNGGSILEETKVFLKKHDLVNSIIFVGPRKREELIEFYQNCDLFVMPSLFEPVGFTAIEAMACGCPVAVSANSGIAECIKDGVSGLLFEPGDADALAGKINYILNLNDTNRDEIGAAARDAVQQLSFENIGRRLEDLYKKVIDQQSKSALLYR